MSILVTADQHMLKIRMIKGAYISDIKLQSDSNAEIRSFEIEANLPPGVRRNRAE
jgi:hypothetical protein